MNKGIVLLCSECFSTTVLFNYVSQKHSIEKVIVETPLRGRALAKRRIKKLGFIKTGGQILFSLIIVRLLKALSSKRINEISNNYSFNESQIPESKLSHIASVNDEKCIEELKVLNPKVVIVNGTRIISEKVLNATDAIFINMHTGITPKYRGVHGGYWALVNNDTENCGVTVHLVDKGIDTGNILFQAKITATKKDNFYTYPFLQLGEGLPLMNKAIENALAGETKSILPQSTDSKLFYHPTILQYLYLRIFKGKK